MSPSLTFVGMGPAEAHGARAFTFRFDFPDGHQDHLSTHIQGFVEPLHATMYFGTTFDSVDEARDYIKHYLPSFANESIRSTKHHGLMKLHMANRVGAAIATDFDRMFAESMASLFE